MAKKSMLEREKKREKMVAKYAELRAELKAKGDYEALSQLPANAVSYTHLTLPTTERV